uniref:Small multi-drug export protein n=2 Tax=Cannabis sativa TaxID=3483 RepID=A0A803Q3H6_CANSA
MVPVPFIMLYLKKLASFAASRNKTVARFVNILFENAKAKAGPIEEFQWLGLMLFVAVPFPGTGAWTGAFIASILDMPFWSALSANFVGVVFAGLLVNLLVNLGLKYAIITGIILFLVSTFMWTILRSIRKSLSSSN